MDLVYVLIYNKRKFRLTDTIVWSRCPGSWLFYRLVAQARWPETCVFGFKLQAFWTGVHSQPGAAHTLCTEDSITLSWLSWKICVRRSAKPTKPNVCFPSGIVVKCFLPTGIPETASWARQGAFLGSIVSCYAKKTQSNLNQTSSWHLFLSV